MRRNVMVRRALFRAVLAGGLLTLTGAVALAKPRTLGWLEWAWLEPAHVRLKTKLDTGARTSSIHAVDVQAFERDGETWVRFRVPLSKRPEDTDHDGDLVLERPVVREVRIKDHEAVSMRRYVVSLDFCTDGMAFTTQVTLANRGGFNYPLLLGRLAMQERIAVDPGRKFTARRSCQAGAAAADDQ
ncbi:MAG: hypothetical protein HKO62_06120 [Gammaproteobacteria bacterium]|nr:hypothetical protein [Gammaproteobacteria bacterium]